MMLFIVFLSAFGAATILPIASEFSVVAAYNDGQNVFWIWFFASAGNTLGAVVNYVLGRYCRQYRDRRWFPIKAKDVDRGSRWFQRYGVWSLLFAWLPIVGDLLTYIAGVMNVRLPLFLLLVALGKSARYAVFIATLMQLS